MGSHNAKREVFSARLLPEGGIFKLEEVGVEISLGLSKKGYQTEVTRQLAKECVCECAAKAWVRLTPGKTMGVLNKTSQIMRNILHLVQFER